MNEPTSPASAPPPMHPTAKQRAQNAIQSFGVLGELLTVATCVEAAYRDGWNAAFAAQPPRDGEPCCDNGNFGDGHECQKQDGAPPQPGDAERLADIRRRHSPAVSAHVCSEDETLSDDGKRLWPACEPLFLLRLLDAARSALAKGRAEAARLTEERDQISATYSRFRQAAHDKLARLRSPTATGEDNQDADLVLEIMTEALDACGIFHTTAVGKLRRALAAARAQGVRVGFQDGHEEGFDAGATVGRAQGVREGIERCAEWARQHSIWFSSDYVAKRAVETIRALAALEPQEDKL